MSKEFISHHVLDFTLGYAVVEAQDFQHNTGGKHGAYVVDYGSVFSADCWIRIIFPNLKYEKCESSGK